MSEAHSKEAHAHGDHGAPETEHDHTPDLSLAIYLFVLTIIIGGMIVGTWAYFSKEADREVARKENASENSVLKEMRTREAELLGKGGKADDLKAGATREAIEKTMARVAADPSLLSPMVAAAPPAPPPAPSAPAPAPAPNNTPEPNKAPAAPAPGSPKN